MLRILIMLFAQLAGFQRERRDRVADEETWAFVETNDGETSSERQRVQPQEAFHLCEAGGIELTDAPRLFQMRL
jgi:hypothetical protein